MAPKHLTLPLMLLLITTISMVSCQGTETWARKVQSGPGKETITNLEFYFHDTVSGANPSAVRVAQANATDRSLTLFGAVLMADDPLTEGPDPKSKLVGRAQGMYGSAAQSELGLIMLMSYCFEDGEYNGSTISILGKNSVMHPVREFPVVGGTGLFRFARGYALARTHWFNLLGDAIVHYNVTLIH